MEILYILIFVVGVILMVRGFFKQTVSSSTIDIEAQVGQIATYTWNASAQVYEVTSCILDTTTIDYRNNPQPVKSTENKLPATWLGEKSTIRLVSMDFPNVVLEHEDISNSQPAFNRKTTYRYTCKDALPSDFANQKPIELVMNRFDAEDYRNEIKKKFKVSLEQSIRAENLELIKAAYQEKHKKPMPEGEFDVDTILSVEFKLSENDSMVLTDTAITMISRAPFIARAKGEIQFKH